MGAYCRASCVRLVRNAGTRFSPDALWRAAGRSSRVGGIHAGRVAAGRGVSRPTLSDGGSRYARGAGYSISMSRCAPGGCAAWGCCAPEGCSARRPAGRSGARAVHAGRVAAGRGVSRPTLSEGGSRYARGAGYSISMSRCSELAGRSMRQAPGGCSARRSGVPGEVQEPGGCGVIDPLYSSSASTVCCGGEAREVIAGHSWCKGMKAGRSPQRPAFCRSRGSVLTLSAPRRRRQPVRAVETPYPERKEEDA